MTKWISIAVLACSGSVALAQEKPVSVISAEAFHEVTARNDAQLGEGTGLRGVFPRVRHADGREVANGAGQAYAYTAVIEQDDRDAAIFAIALREALAGTVARNNAPEPQVAAGRIAAAD